MDSDPLADFPALVKFSRERLDEDRDVTQGLAFACRNPDLSPDFFGCGGPAAEAFWERFDPERRLRETEGKRALLNAYEVSVRMVGPGLSRQLLGLVALQATAWDDHPDYLPEWKP